MERPAEWRCTGQSSNGARGGLVENVVSEASDQVTACGASESSVSSRMAHRGV